MLLSRGPRSAAPSPPTSKKAVQQRRASEVQNQIELSCKKIVLRVIYIIGWLVEDASCVVEKLGHAGKRLLSPAGLRGRPTAVEFTRYSAVDLTSEFLYVAGVRMNRVCCIQRSNLSSDAENSFDKKDKRFLERYVKTAQK